MKTVPGGNLSSGIFPSCAMATEKMADIYQWLAEQLSEIGLEEFHVRSIVAYFFMNLQDLEDESSQECGLSPAFSSNSNGRRHTGFEVVPLQDRRKHCAELYIKNVSSKDPVPVAVVKKIVSELSTRLTSSSHESASPFQFHSQNQESSGLDYTSDSPMDRYNKAFPPLSEDNSPTQLSPPEDNVWTQRRPLTSKLAGETSQKNGAIGRQPQAGTKRDTPSRRTKTGHGKENDLTSYSRKKSHPSRRRDLIQYSYTARQLSYPVPQKQVPPYQTTSQEDEEKKSKITEYLITALGIKSSGSARRAANNSNQPSSTAAYFLKPSAPQRQKKEKEVSDGPVFQDTRFHDQEARLPAHMFPAQFASSEQSCSPHKKEEVRGDVASKEGTATQLKVNTSCQSAYDGWSAFPSSPALSDQEQQHGASASYPDVQQCSYSQNPEVSEKWPQTEVTITADQRDMFAAFSPKDEPLSSQDACYRILPYEILERETKKKEKDDTHNCDLYPCAHTPNQIPDSQTTSYYPAEDAFPFLSSSLSHTPCSKQDTENSHISYSFKSAHGPASLKESVSFPCLHLSRLDLSTMQKNEDECLCQTCKLEYENDPRNSTCRSSPSCSTYADRSAVPLSNFLPSQVELWQWIQYFQSLHWPNSEEASAILPCTSCSTCLNGDARWCQHCQIHNTASAQQEDRDLYSDHVTFTLGDSGGGQENVFPRNCSSQDEEAIDVIPYLGLGLDFTSSEKEHIQSKLASSGQKKFSKELFESSLDGAENKPDVDRLGADQCDLDVNSFLKSMKIPGYTDSVDPELKNGSLSFLGYDQEGARFSRNSERRGILCQTYSPLKVESSNSEAAHKEDDSLAYRNGNPEFDKYCHSIWSNDNGSLFGQPSLSMGLYHLEQDSAKSQLQSGGDGEPAASHCSVLPYSNYPAANSTEKPHCSQQAHPHNSYLDGGQEELACGELDLYWMYERQSPLGYNVDVHLSFPSFHQSHCDTLEKYNADCEKYAERESSCLLPSTASSSLPKQTGAHPSSSTDVGNSWTSHHDDLPLQQLYASTSLQEKFKRSHGEESDSDIQQHFQESSDQKLTPFVKCSLDAKSQWQPKQGLLGVDWLPSPTAEVEGNGDDDDDKRGGEWSSAVEDSWFSPWLEVVGSNTTHSRVFPLLHAYSSCHQFPNKDSLQFTSLPCTPSTQLPLDRSVSDSILSIPSDTSAFRPYIRSNSLPSLKSQASSTQHSIQHLHEIPRKDSLTPREREFLPIPAQATENEDQAQQQQATQQSPSEILSPVIQLQDIFGTPTPSEVQSCTDKAIQTGEEFPVPFQRTLYPSLSDSAPATCRSSAEAESPDPLSPPSTDSETFSDDDRPQPKEKSWKEMQDVTDEDRFADAIYYFQQYGTLPHVFPSAEEVKEDLYVMEQAAVTDFHNGQENSYAASCAVPIPQQAVHVEQLEEEMFQRTGNSRSAAYGSQRSRRKQSKLSSRAKQPRGPVFNNKPCSFFLEGQCYRADCKYSHDMSSITCCFWQAGQCFKGHLCPFLHGYSGQDDRETGRTVKDAAPSVVELTTEDFPQLSGSTQDYHGHSGTIHKKKKMKKNGVRNQPRGN